MLSFTRQEKWALLILGIALLVGMGIDFYQQNFAPSRIHKIPAGQEVLVQQKQKELASKQQVNPNTATSEELQRVPGIGPQLAERIIAYRQEHGYFAMLEDLRKVSGVGPSTYKKIEPYLSL